MAKAIAEIEDKIRALSGADKKQLLRTLIAELDAPADPDVERAWLEEAQKRHRELVEGTVKPVSGKHVFENLRARLRG